jgi:hypothetical protein
MKVLHDQLRGHLAVVLVFIDEENHLHIFAGIAVLVQQVGESLTESETHRLERSSAKREGDQVW